MVEEAQALRARVLADLARRRKVLHAQIEQLRAGRERLAETITGVRQSVDTIAEELFNAENEARLAAEVAGREAAARPDDGTPEELAALLLAEEAEEGLADADAADGIDAAPVGPAADTDVAGADLAATDEADTASGGDGGAPQVRPVEQVDALFAKLRAAQDDPDGAEEPVGAEEPEGTSSREDPAPPDTVAGTTAASDGSGEAADGGEGESADEADGPPDARNPLAVQRDELVTPLVTALSRRLKRTLQDSQNELLDRLRAKGTTWSADLLPEETEHLDAVTTAQTVIGSRESWLALNTQNQTAASTARATEESQIGDTDVSAAAIKLQELTTALQASQSTFVRLSSLSLFSMIGN